MKKKHLLAGAALTLVAALSCAAFTGCSGSDSQAEGEKDTAAAETEYAPIAVSYLNKTYYEDIIVGDAKGFFTDCGPEVTLNVVEGSGQQSVEALLGGSVDIAATGQGPVADAIKQYGDDIVILAGTICMTGEQAWVAGPNMVGDMAITPYDAATDNKADVKASFENAAAAKGSSILIGVQNGSTTAGNLKSWLKGMEISFNDFDTEGDGVVSLVDLKANTLATTLATGTDIDIMAASQPFPNTALESVEGSYQIGTNADTNTYNAMLLITTKEIYAEKEDSIKAFLEADKKATDFMNENPDEAITICAESMGVDEANVKAIFDQAAFQTNLTDQMVSTLAKACKSKEVEITEDELKAQMPLFDWLNNELNK